MATYIVTDSTCDLGWSKEESTKKGIIFAPLKVIFSGVEYRDGEDISKTEFFEKLVACEELPTTSQVNPDEFDNIFRPIVERGDSIIGIFISSSLSGTYNSACLAAKMIGSENIHVIDSNTTVMALGLLVRETLKLIEQNVPTDEIVKTITDLTKRVKIVAFFSSLKYLKMGGRVSAAKAMVAGMLGIYPIIEFKDNKLDITDKKRGKANALQHLVDHVNGLDIDTDYPMAYAYSVTDESAKELCKILSKKYPNSGDFTDELGAVIGTHVGPGACGVAYIVK